MSFASKIRKKARIFLSLYVLSLLSLFSSCLFAKTVYAAPDWGAPASITAGAAIVMDADSGAILYGRNINEQHYPASITKIMTALLVLENCSLDETVTFSQTAVSNLEPGAVTAFTSAGDQLTVRDCLYALLFRSANEVANALAEHVSGSVEAFAALMNERARELGCLNTHFVNPNGLSSTEHVTTAYDMALIARACMDNKKFLEIESTDTYKMAGTKLRPNGLTLTIGHKMLRSGTPYSDERVVGGKTGFTTASGNTLVTMAEDGGRRLVVVCLQDKTPAHYTDTKAMLDYGFSHFENMDGDSFLTKKQMEERLIADTIVPAEGSNSLRTDRTFVATVPKGAAPTDLTVRYNYNLPDSAPESAVAQLELRYGDHTAGSFYLLNDRESILNIENISTPTKVAIGVSAVAVAGGIAAFFLLGGGTAWHMHNVRVERIKLQRAKRRRRRRLESMGISEEEFGCMVAAYQEKHDKRRGASNGRKSGPRNRT